MALLAPAAVRAEGDSGRTPETRRILDALAESTPGSAPVADRDAGASTLSRAAEAAAGLPRTRPSGRPIGRVSFLAVAPASDPQEMARRWLLPRTVDLDAVAGEVALAVAAAIPVVDRKLPPAIDGDVDALLAGTLDDAGIARVNQALDLDAVIVANVHHHWGASGSYELELRLVAGRTEAGVFRASERVRVPGDLAVWNPRALALLGVAALFALARSFRGRGHLSVRVAGATDEGNGETTYTAYVSLRSLADAKGSDAFASKALSGAAGAHFEGLVARRWVVTVRRVFRDPESLQVTKNQTVEKTVEVRRGQTARLTVDFPAEKVRVVLRLLQGPAGEQEAAGGQALVSVPSANESTRYVRGGEAALMLPAGVHDVLVGYADRAYRVRVKVEADAGETEARVDVDSSQKAVFTGCADAVPAFVQGDLEAAADALAANGLSEPASLLRAELHRSMGRSQEAARELESAGRLRDAARLRAAAGDTTGTAALLERAGDFAGAAEQHRAAGDLPAAVAAFLNARRFDDALACAQRSGDRSLLLDVLEQRGDRLEAARMCLEIDDVGRAISLLQRVGLSDPTYGEACLLLAQLFQQRDEPQLALQKLDEAVDVFGSETSLELREQIARRLEAAREFELALECYEHIRKRDIGYAGMAEKIDELRGKLRVGTARTTGGGATSPARDEGRYVVEEEVGRGGMGVVYRAQDTVLGRTVALKRLPDNLKDHPAAVKLFLREARSAAALNHPNVVTVFDAGQTRAGYYLTMEFMKGLPMDEVLKRKGRFNLAETLWLAAEVAKGLDYAHGEGIVHRDIKPSNLFLTDKKVVKIMDFGLAKMMEEVRKSASIIAGTPYYMAPEQALGEAVDGRADLYAFGISLYEFLLGHCPFTEGDVLYHHRHTPPPDPRDEMPGIPDALAELILALIAKDPAQRVPDAAFVGQRIAEIQARTR